MKIASVRQWMAEQLKRGHSLCLILDSEGELAARQTLLKNHDAEPYFRVYSETPVADLADAGPFIFLINSPDNEHIKALLEVPERNWGWLASIGKDDLTALTRHWRERVIIGTPPNQALYRFHDNRALTRAFGHIPEEARPGYLGPAISVCFWQGSQWDVIDNPAPGIHPVPADPAWLNVPVPASQSMAMLHSNIYRYLWAEHSDELMRLSQRQDPSTWLAEQLSQARQWGWDTPEQLHFLIINTLNETEPPRLRSWLPHAGEAPQVHFERLLNEVKFWSEE